jgi:hypothetical protein
MGSRKVVPQRIPFGGITVDQGATRVRQSEELGRFVEGLARGIIEGFTQHGQQVGRFTQNNLRMPAAYSKTKKRERGFFVGQKIGQHMRLHMMHPDQGLSGSQGQRFGKAAAHQQGAHQPG